MTAIMAQRKVGEDEILKDAPVANIQFYKNKSLTIINGSYGKRKKWRGKFTRHLTTTFREKGGSYKRNVIREKN